MKRFNTDVGGFGLSRCFQPVSDCVLVGHSEWVCFTHDRPGVDLQSEGEHSGCVAESSAHPRTEAPQEAVAGDVSASCCAVMTKAHITLITAVHSCVHVAVYCRSHSTDLLMSLFSIT